MKAEQIRWVPGFGWLLENSQLLEPDLVQLVLVFGSAQVLRSSDRIAEIKTRYPGAILVGASGMGAIAGRRFVDGSLVATAIQFHSSRVMSASARQVNERPTEIARKLIEPLDDPELKHVLLFGAGAHTTGDDIVSGVNEVARVPVTGAFAADRVRGFSPVVLCDGEACKDAIVAIGIAGKSLDVRFKSMTGWGHFGIERTITKSEGNVVHEIDGEPALKLYMRYLGEYARDIPDVGQQFPLCFVNDEGIEVIRGAIGVDPSSQSVHYGGFVPSGVRAHLMHATVDSLAEAAAGAARACYSYPDSLFFVASSAGRYLAMRGLVEEELDMVVDNAGQGTVVTGVYDLAEFMPNSRRRPCELNNESIAITSLYELPEQG